MGSGYDFIARLFARHFGRQLPGNPNVVVSNLQGGLGLPAANYIYNAAPRDGTAIGALLQNLAEEQVLGSENIRYDARFEGYDIDAAGENPGYDPSSTGITGAFVSAFHDYLDRELKYTNKETYLPRGINVNQIWDHTHRPPGGGGPGQGQAQPMRDAYVAGDLADAMRKNPKLKIFSANGLFDLATPFFITEFDLAHMELEPKLRGNIEFGYYHSGHMIYLNVDALKQLKLDLAGFYAHATEGL